MRNSKSSRSVRLTVLAATSFVALLSIWLVGGPADAEGDQAPIQSVAAEG